MPTRADLAALHSLRRPLKEESHVYPEPVASSQPHKRFELSRSVETMPNIWLRTMRVRHGARALDAELQRTTMSPLLAMPAERFMRLVVGSCSAGRPRKCHVLPSSSLAQQSRSPSHRPWQGWLKIRATREPSLTRWRLGQAQTPWMAVREVTPNREESCAFADGGAATASPPATGDAPGELIPTSKTVRVLIGGVEAMIIGPPILHPTLVGLNQINAFVPEGVEPGDEVPIVIEVDCGDGNVFRSRSDVTIAVRAEL